MNDDYITESQKRLMNLCEKQGVPNMKGETYIEWANFLFYTSWFEETLFTYNDRQNPENDLIICEKLSKKIDLKKYDYFGEYLCKRYLDNNNKTTDNFRKLRLSNNSPAFSKKTTRKALIDYKTNKARDNNLLFAYLMIIYRFRNNMFHGSKKLINLPQYTEPISIINRFMNQLLEDIFSCQYTGFRASN